MDQNLKSMVCGEEEVLTVRTPPRSVSNLLPSAPLTCGLSDPLSVFSLTCTCAVSHQACPSSSTQRINLTTSRQQIPLKDQQQQWSDSLAEVWVLEGEGTIKLQLKIHKTNSKVQFLFFYINLAEDDLFDKMLSYFAVFIVNA